MIGKHLKEYKRRYLADRRAEHYKTRIKKNSDWRKRWMPFIKYDHDFDGGFFLELIVHKLHIMLDYYDHGKYCHQVDESRLQIVEELKEACRLGDMLMADKFEDAAFQIMSEHHRVWAEPSKTMPGLSEIKGEWDDPKNKELYDKASKAGCDLRERTIGEFFEYLGKHYRDWWD